MAKIPPPGTRGAKTHELLEAERRQKLVELVKRGSTFDEIAKELGYYDRSGAYKAFQRALEAIEKPTAEEALKIQLERFQTAIKVVMEAIENEDAPIEVRLAAIDRLAKIEQRIAKLFGLEVDVSVSADVPADHPAVSEAIQRMLAKPAAKLAACVLAETMRDEDATDATSDATP